MFSKNREKWHVILGSPSVLYLNFQIKIWWEYIKGVRQISTIFVTDDYYLCYKEPINVFTTFFSNFNI